MRRRSILFHREYMTFSGGHLMHSRYFDIISKIPSLEAKIYFTPNSLPVEKSPWSAFADKVVREWDPSSADILFIAGLDWLALPAERKLDERLPVVNLIQGVIHADPADVRYTFLGRRALRICVSPEVRDAVLATGRCNGEVVMIPNGVHIPPQFRDAASTVNDIAIASLKQPSIAVELAGAFERLGLKVDLIEPTDRRTFLQRLSSAKVALLLPHEREGFYLPALEAMALGKVVVCPDCVGNRSFCRPSLNCLVPANYDLESLIASSLEALALTPSREAAMVDAARRTAQEHSDDLMRRRVEKLLEEIPVG